MQRKQRKSTAGKGDHPIQVVSRRTGLGTDVIRVWERRYEAVTPTRDAVGRRLYSDADVERLLLLRRATEAGRRIGDVARLEQSELARLVAEDEAHAAPRLASSGARDAAGQLLEMCFAAIEAVSPAELESVLQRAAVSLSTPALLDKILIPLLRDIGERCRRGDLRVSHEHAATAVLRTFLAQRVAEHRVPERAPVLVVATPTGQRHELGALMVELSATAEGWRVVYLGPDLPVDEISFVARETNASAVALSIVYPPDDPALAEALRRLKHALPAGVPLYVGGLAVGGYEGVLKEVGAIVPADLYEFRSLLDQLRKRR